MKPINNSNQFQILFRGFKTAGYQYPINLTDTNIGFSIQRCYPENIRFKPAKTTSGKDDDVAVVWIVYEESLRKNGADLIPIRFRIGTMSKYRAKHWDYDFEKPDCPTRESVEIRKKSVQPLEMNLIDEFFYSESKGYIVNTKGKKTRGIDILNYLFDYHCNTTHPIKGLGVRTKNSLAIFSLRGLDKTISSIKWALKYVFGRTLDEQTNRNSHLDGYLEADFKKTADNSLELGGYRTTKRVILLFSALVALACFFCLPVKDESYVGNLLHDDFLLIIHSLLGLFILDEVIPIAIFRLMNSFISLRKIYLNFLLKR
jgi:hypothetical protein